MKTNKELFLEYKEKLNRLFYVISILSYDSNTTCPKNDLEYAFEIENYFSIEADKILKSEKFYQILKSLNDNPSDLNEIEKLEIKYELEQLNKERMVPQRYVKKSYPLFSKAHLDWLKGRENQEYKDFVKDLDALIKYYKGYAKYVDEKSNSYDVLLDVMEDGMNIQKYDELFDLIKKELHPLYKKCIKAPKKYNEKIKTLRFDIKEQERLTEEIAQIMGFKKEFGVIRTTIHPFSNTINMNDSRITTSYHEDLLFSNVYSIMHEIGHSLYELGNKKELNNTFLFGGTSMGIHESQSRFYENYLGRSRSFIEFLYPILIKHFKELEEFSVDDIYYYVNDVTKEPLRIEADELSYPFHIIIRYEIEKKLFSGEIKGKDVPKYFNQLFKEYFGYIPSSLTLGAFQDIHWTSDFGYFPTYALGSAFGAQFYNKMKSEIDIDKDLRKGDFSNITSWLGSHIHQFGKSKKNFEIIKYATNEEFNPRYYIDYLKNKFGRIYDINEN